MDRKESSLDQYYESPINENLARIRAVSMDMWDPYNSSTIERVPGAHRKILFDSFHVKRHVNEAVDSVRKEGNRELVKKCIMELNIQGIYGYIHSRTFRERTGNVAIS